MNNEHPESSNKNRVVDLRRPDVLERFSMGIMLVLILLTFAIANVQALLWVGSDWLVSSILPAVIVDSTNEKRDTENLSPLVRNIALDRAATLKAEDMARNGYFAHYSPTGVTPWHWFDEVGYDYIHAGENLAVHFTDSDTVVDAWMNSPTHRANIMNSEYFEIGVGSARGTYNGHETIFVVQLFGTKRMPTTLVAGVETESTPSITIEKVTTSGQNADVAPATLVTENLVQTEVEDVPAPVTPPEVPIEPEPVVAETQQPDAVESFVETTRMGEPETTSPIATEAVERELPYPVRSATEPGLWLSTVYGALALLTVVMLLLSLVYEVQRHHLMQTAYAGGLLAVMAMLLYIHTSLTGSVLIL
jgi:uncharacterized integral membrane protein